MLCSAPKQILQAKIPYVLKSAEYIFSSKERPSIFLGLLANRGPLDNIYIYVWVS